MQNRRMAAGKRTERNRSELAADALLMAAGVVISVFLVSLLIGQYKSSRELANAVTENIDESIRLVEESGMTMYDGMTVKGSDMLNFCGRYGDDADSPDILLLTGEVQYVFGRDIGLSRLRDKRDPMYILPGSEWKCEVIRNDNRVITAVRFTEV